MNTKTVIHFKNYVGMAITGISAGILFALLAGKDDDRSLLMYGAAFGLACVCGVRIPGTKEIPHGGGDGEFDLSQAEPVSPADPQPEGNACASIGSAQAARLRRLVRPLPPPVLTPINVKTAPAVPAARSDDPDAPEENI